jgi:hypothetical protein
MNNFEISAWRHPGNRQPDGITSYIDGGNI